MGVFLDRLGLKTVSCKRGKRGEQVTYRHLSHDETDFALEFLEYRQQLRQQKEEKERLLREERDRYQAVKERQYGINPSTNPVSPPPANGVFYNLEGGEDTSKNQESGSPIPPWETWEVFKPYQKLRSDAISLGVDAINQIVKGIGEGTDLFYRIVSSLTESMDWIWTQE